MVADEIIVRGAREHNLKNVCCVFPANKVVVVTGVSGSGKSSLVFDTIAREAERRIFEAQLPLAASSKGRVRRPQVDAVEGLSFVVALEKRLRNSPNATLATLSGVYPALSQLFFHAAVPQCLECGALLHASSRSEMCEQLFASLSQSIIVCGLIGTLDTDECNQKIVELAKAGFTRVRIGEAIVAIDDYQPQPEDAQVMLSVVIDKFSVATVARARVFEALDTALSFGNGRVLLVDDDGVEQVLSAVLDCDSCGAIQERRGEEAFSYFRVAGRCQQCEGQGTEENRVCSLCGGSRLEAVVGKRLLAGRMFSEILTIPVAEVSDWLASVSAAEEITKVGPVQQRVSELRARVSLLRKLGLEYLALSRSASSLSSGERARAELARYLGSDTAGVLYLLDEPTTGLHPQDVGKVSEVLRELRDAGNSVVVVEHDCELMKTADYFLALGPGAGASGGELMAAGTMQELGGLAPSEKQLFPSAFFDSGKSKRMAEVRTPKNISDDSAWLQLCGANSHNLKNIDIRFPLNAITAVAGVSGSGKSTLIMQTIAEAVRASCERNSNADNQAEKGYASIAGVETLAGVVDAGEYRRSMSRRSVVATMLRVFTPLRELFAQTIEARAFGYKKDSFSFNTKVGACEECGGAGSFISEAPGFPELELSCVRCEGKRLRPELLRPRFRGYSIADVLELTVSEAAVLFKNIPAVSSILARAVHLGCGYLTLGQEQRMLSLGEFQRLRMLADLGRERQEPTLYLFDEPARGLHESDIIPLVSLFEQLVERGHTVVFVEHNPQLVQAADYLLELGPGAGVDGGSVVFQGPLSAATKDSKSIIRQFF